MSLFSRQTLKKKASLVKASQARYNVTNLKSVLIKEASEKPSSQTFDIFLSHSFLDADEVLAIVETFKELGYSTYVDWIDDSQLDRAYITARTADTIRTRMRNSRSLLYVVSVNSAASKWMPWELGYFDGVKGTVATLPIIDTGTETFERQEYLKLYPYVDMATVRENPNTTKLWVNDGDDTYVEFDQWLQGKLPSKRA